MKRSKRKPLLFFPVLWLGIKADIDRIFWHLLFDYKTPDQCSLLCIKYSFDIPVFGLLASSVSEFVLVKSEYVHELRSGGDVEIH